MAKFDPPRLTVGGLSGDVFVITHGKVVGVREGREIIESSVKHVVTDQFHALAAELLGGVRLPGLWCPTCGRIAYDAGGGRACHTDDHEPCGVMETVWLAARVVGPREEATDA